MNTPEKAPVRKILKWAPLALVSLIVFTFLKFPTYQIRTRIQDVVTSSLQPMGVSLTAEETTFSLWMGLRYQMKNVSVSFSQSPQLVRLDRLTVRPSLLSLVQGKIGGSLSIEKGSQEISVKFSGNQTGMDLSLALDDANLVDLGLLQALVAMSPMLSGPMGELIQSKPSMALSGKLKLRTAGPNMKTVNGKTHLVIQKFLIPKTRITVVGFGALNLPRLQLTGGTVQTEIVDGKIQIQALEFGKAGSSDDLIGSISGKVDLGQRVSDGSLDLQTQFKLSETFLKDLGPIGQGILNSAKSGDGSYRYKISGSPVFPQYTPTP